MRSTSDFVLGFVVESLDGSSSSSEDGMTDYTAVNVVLHYSTLSDDTDR